MVATGFMKNTRMGEAWHAVGLRPTTASVRPSVGEPWLCMDLAEVKASSIRGQLDFKPPRTLSALSGLVSAE